MNKTLCAAVVGAAFQIGAHAQATGGYHYNSYGVLVNAQGQPANPHQQYHDMTNPALWTVGATAVSNTVDPNFQQANLPTIEGAMAPNPEPGGQAMSRLYLTPTNPYTPNTGVQSGSPVGYNYDHYQLIMQQAPGSGYVATESGAYIAKTHPGSSSTLANWGFNTYEASPNFLAAKEAAGGKGGGIVVMANQSAESYSHLKAISGSNEYMTAYARLTTGGVVVLGGQVVLNPEHNTTPALDTEQYGPAFVAGVSQIQGQTLATGNEQGFWVYGSGVDTSLASWGNGSSESIQASYDPSAQFHVHTHPSNTGPSYTDFLASASLGGMPGMVVSGNGSYAYGFQVAYGYLPAADGSMVTFADRGWATGRPSEVGDSQVGASSTRNPSGPTRGTFTFGVSGEGTFGQGVQGTGAIAIGFDSQGNLNVGVYGSVQTTGGYLLGGGPVIGVSSAQLSAGTSANPVSTMNVGTGAVSGSASVDLSNPSNVSAVRGGPAAMAGASVGVGVEGTAATTVIGGRTIDAAASLLSSSWGAYGSAQGATYGFPGAGQSSSGSESGRGASSTSSNNTSFNAGTPSSSTNPNNPGSYGSPGY